MTITISTPQEMVAGIDELEEIREEPNQLPLMELIVLRNLTIAALKFAPTFQSKSDSVSLGKSLTR